MLDRITKTPEFLITTELADLLRVKPDTIRRSLCVKGHYLGLTPKKGPNGRLLWPTSDARGIVEGHA